jgi:hypothetical protein
MQEVVELYNEDKLQQRFQTAFSYPLSTFEPDTLDGMTVAVRTRREPEEAMSELGSIVRQVDPLVPIGSLRATDLLIDESL